MKILRTDENGNEIAEVSTVELDTLFTEVHNNAINEFANRMISMMPGHQQDIQKVADQLKKISEDQPDQKKELSMKYFTKGNSDDINAAVEGLDQFMKNWCMNCKATEETNDLVFRCNECNFQFDDDRCQIKKFVVDKLGNVPADFGSMGSH